MERKIAENLAKIEELNNYQSSQKKTNFPNNASAEISIRLTLDKIYKSEELTTEDLMNLRNFVEGMSFYNMGFNEDFDQAVQYGMASESMLNNPKHYSFSEEEILKNAYKNRWKEIEDIANKDTDIQKKISV